MDAHRFIVIGGEFEIARLGPHDRVPDWAQGPGPLVSITRTADELSIVGPAGRALAGARVETAWVALMLIGPFPFDQVGVLASFTTPLAAAGISLFALSTFDTDFILVKAERLAAALAALTRAGHVQEAP